MSQEKFWVLFSKKLSGEATADDNKELEVLIHQHPEWQYSIQTLEDLWHQKPGRDYMHEEDAYLLHIHRMKELNISFDEYPDESKNMVVVSSNRRKWYWAAAAIFLSVLGLFIFGNFSGRKNQVNEQVTSYANEVSTRPGSKSMIKLPDGSVVWLNAGSKITYNKDFGVKIREVTLTGEGFFDVAKNKEKPFIIHTASINIKVLGTAFNVKAYPEDKLTETSLIRGSIEVTIKNRPNDKIILSPSEKLIVENNLIKPEARPGISSVPVQAAPVVPEPMVSINKLKYSVADSSVAETQWINNKLVFRDETFEDLAVKMERWYDVKIEISDPRLKQARLNGIFESETILQALEALTISIPFRYEQTGSKIIIHR